MSTCRCRWSASNVWRRAFYFLHSSAIQEEDIMATLAGSESHSTGGIHRNYPSNIITKLTTSKITGQGFSRGTQVGVKTNVGDSCRTKFVDSDWESRWDYFGDKQGIWQTLVKILFLDTYFKLLIIYSCSTRCTPSQDVVMLAPGWRKVRLNLRFCCC